MQSALTPTRTPRLMTSAKGSTRRGKPAFGLDGRYVGFEGPVPEGVGNAVLKREYLVRIWYCGCGCNLRHGSVLSVQTRSTLLPA